MKLAQISALLLVLGLGPLLGSGESDPRAELGRYDCCDLKRLGFADTKPYTIKLNETNFLNVWCDMTTNGGGWTIIQRRHQEVPYTDFFRNWSNYRVGINMENSRTSSYWIGLDNMAELTKLKNQEVRFDMESFTKGKAYATYSSFHVAGEEQKYKLSISGYAGTAGDSMAGHNNQFFSTYNFDNDKDPKVNCALHRRSGWWFQSCVTVNGNGILYPQPVNDWSSVCWQLLDQETSLRSFSFKIRNSGGC